MKKILLVAMLVFFTGNVYAQWGSRGAFLWSVSGNTVKQDSLRLVQGSNITLTQNGNAVTIAGAAGGSGITPAGAHQHTGWTSNATTATDTLAREYLLTATGNALMRFGVVGVTNDSLLLSIKGGVLNYLFLKDGSNVLAAVVDSVGRLTSGGTFSTNGTASLDGSGSQPLVQLQASDGDVVQFTTNTSDQAVFSTASGGLLAPKFNSNGNILPDTLTYSVTLIDTVKAADVVPILKLAKPITVVEIAAHTNTGTATFNIEKRAEATPNTAGTDIMTSDLVADSDQQETTTFSSANASPDQWLVLAMSAVASGAQRLNVTIKYLVR